MREKKFEGRDVDEALANAAAELGVEKEGLEYEVLDDDGDDFWGLGEPTARIRAWPKAAAPAREVGDASDVRSDEVLQEDETVGADPVGTREGEPSGQGKRFWGGEEAERRPEAAEAGAAPETEADFVEPSDGERGEGAQVAGDGPEGAVPSETTEGAQSRPPDSAAAESGAEAQATSRDEWSVEEGDEAPDEASDAPPPEIDDPHAEISALLSKVFEGMEFECEAEVDKEDDSWAVMISGDDVEYLVEGNGRALSALELLLNHAFRHRLPKGRKIRVDAGDFRTRREEELRDLAFQVAHSAKQSGSTQETQPLNPYERRLVHLALAEDKGVSTRSRGSGFLKNVQVIPRRGGRGQR